MSAEAPAGLLVVDKPAGPTSHDVVARVRRLARTRRVGHAGTLDPMATGVLLLGVGRATRLLGHLALVRKAYTATVRLGSGTTTDDAEGEVVSRRPADHLTDEQVRLALASFRGDLLQRPSSVSAVKVDGRRAHARVRDGEQLELPARPVTVHDLDVLAVRHDGRAQSIEVDLAVTCSSGFYVRALARDLGEALGVGGHLSALRRTSVGPVGLADAVPLAELEEDPERLGTALLGLDQAVGRFFPTLAVGPDLAAAVRHGRPLDLALPAEGPVAVLDPDGVFLALYADRPESSPRTRPVAVFV